MVREHPLLSAKMLAVLAVLGVLWGGGMALILADRLPFVGIAMGFLASIAIISLYGKPLQQALETGKWDGPDMPSKTELVIAVVCAVGAPLVLIYLYLFPATSLASRPPQAAVGEANILPPVSPPLNQKLGILTPPISQATNPTPQAKPSRVAKVPPKEKTREKVAETIEPLFIECNNGFMPTLNIGPNDRVSVLNLSGAPGRADMVQMFLKAGGAFSMDGPDKIPKQAWTCKLTNYNSTPIIGLMISFHIKWFKTEKEGNTTRMLGLNSENDNPNQITKIEPGSSNPFIFYTENLSENVADITFPLSVIGTRLDTNETVAIPLRSEPPRIQVWPGS